MLVRIQNIRGIIRSGLQLFWVEAWHSVFWKHAQEEATPHICGPFAVANIHITKFKYENVLEKLKCPWVFQTDKFVPGLGWAMASSN